MRQRNGGSIILVLLSPIGEGLATALVRGLETAFGRPVEVRYSIVALERYYDPARGQYVSPRFLSRLKRVRRGRADKVLGVLDVDLYSPDYDFVFGEADVAAGVATVSLFRLRPENYGLPADPALLERRLVKEAMHELGHLYGLLHCDDPACVMRFCPSLDDVDSKRGAFCARCMPATMEPRSVALAHPATRRPW